MRGHHPDRLGPQTPATAGPPNRAIGRDSGLESSSAVLSAPSWAARGIPHLVFYIDDLIQSGGHRTLEFISYLFNLAKSDPQ